MEKIKLTKKEADRIMKIKGRVSGSVIKEYYHFILDRKGKEGVDQIEKRLKDLGYDVKIQNVSAFGWYSHALACLILIAIVEFFDGDELTSFEIGYNAPSYSIIAKLLLNYVSIEKMVKGASKYWSKYMDFGEIKCTEYDMKKGYAVLRLDNFKKFHAVTYAYIRGFLTRLVEMATKSKKVNVKQTKSLFENDPYDEFKITW